ncbi:MAG: hypothetical protein AB1516_06900 [Pseudomonadota bacterium]
MKSHSYGKPFDISVRLLLATIGGYFISMWAATLLAPVLPGHRHTQVLTAIEIVFLIYLAIFIWAFTRLSLKRLSLETFAALLITGAAVWATHGGLS